MVFTAANLIAQDEVQKKQEVDPSKPTNLYTQINSNLEGSFSDAQDLFGLRVNASYAANPNNLFLNTNSRWKSVWTGEFSMNYIFIPNKLKANIFWGPNFTNKIHVIRAGTTFYL